MLLHDVNKVELTKTAWESEQKRVREVEEKLQTEDCRKVKSTEKMEN